MAACSVGIKVLNLKLFLYQLPKELTNFKMSVYFKDFANQEQDSREVVDIPASTTLNYMVMPIQSSTG